MKRSKIFSFIYPVSLEFRDLSRGKGKRIGHVIDLVINGVGYENEASAMDPVEKRFDVDIKEISDGGVNILPFFNALSCMNDIKQACLHHVYRLFSGDKFPLSDYQGNALRYHW